MLPKSRRLTTVDFKNLRRGKAINTPHFLLRLFPAAKGEEKAAVIVSAAAFKKAVHRNLLRRRMYHIIEAHLPLLQGSTLTVTLKKGTLGISFKELEREFFAALEQINRRTSEQPPRVTET